MDGLKSLIEDYLRLAWPPFVAGAILGLIIGAWLF
jgi:hypothetical protein